MCKKFFYQHCEIFFFSVILLQHQELCRKLHKEMDLVDEERYDMEIKAKKATKEVCKVWLPATDF